MVQDQSTGEVLMLAYANREAVALTLKTGELHLYSRSRKEIWHKGATSGNTQQVRSIRHDCDADALLIFVEPDGPACHTGERTCFHGPEDAPRVPAEALPRLARTVAERAIDRPEGSYTTQLLSDLALAREKVEEEAEEVGRAVADESDRRVAEETADLLYHLIVLIKSRGLTLDDAARVLEERADGAS